MRIMRVSKFDRVRHTNKRSYKHAKRVFNKIRLFRGGKRK